MCSYEFKPARLFRPGFKNEHMTVEIKIENKSVLFSLHCYYPNCVDGDNIDTLYSECHLFL